MEVVESDAADSEDIAETVGLEVVDLEAAGSEDVGLEIVDPMVFSLEAVGSVVLYSEAVAIACTGFLTV